MADDDYNTAHEARAMRVHRGKRSRRVPNHYLPIVLLSPPRVKGHCKLTHLGHGNPLESLHAAPPGLRPKRQLLS